VEVLAAVVCLPSCSSSVRAVNMLALISRLLDWFRSLFWKEEMELTLVGLQYSGKTTFVNVIAVSTGPGLGGRRAGGRASDSAKARARPASPGAADGDGTGAGAGTWDFPRVGGGRCSSGVSTLKG
jgi:hypothetical protein